MAAGAARASYARTGRRVQIFDRNGQPRWHPLWEGLQYIARPGETGAFDRITNGPGVRPYHTGKSNERWTYNLDFRADRAEIVLTDAELAFGAQLAGRIIVEPHIKAKASPNKQWGWVRWNKLAYLARERGIVVTQLGIDGTATLEFADFVATPTIRHAAAVLRHARAAVLPEGGLHHLAAAVGLPSVVLFGGFTPVELTGYEGHVNIGASLGDACGMRVPCKHCEQWMASITPERVLDELLRIIEA